MNLPKKLAKSVRGFTLIEILLVVAILSILLVVVFASLNPVQRLAETRNARRWNDVNQILTALHECIIDNNGSMSTCGLTSPTLALSQIGSCATGGATLCTGAAAACVNLEADTDLDPYIGSFPLDPSTGTGATTAYAVQVANSIITVSSCQDELSEVIQVSR
jgi:prepilin-type N-terminal cleavage/methylation domain-containing protein